jgi:hypothetical protein
MVPTIGVFLPSLTGTTHAVKDRRVDLAVGPDVIEAPWRRCRPVGSRLILEENVPAGQLLEAINNDPRRRVADSRG